MPAKQFIPLKTPREILDGIRDAGNPSAAYDLVSDEILQRFKQVSWLRDKQTRLLKQVAAMKTCCPHCNKVPKNGWLALSKSAYSDEWYSFGRVGRYAWRHKNDDCLECSNCGGIVS